MHGVKRVRQTSEAIQARKLKEQSKIKEYLALSQDILSRKKQCDWSKDALNLTTRLLQINPEFYTVWNYRRKILLHGIFPDSTPEEVNDILSGDLSMTMAALKAHPKVYWIWNHRRWCLENVPGGPGLEGEIDFFGWKKANWDRELYVVEKMLDADARNFQAWDYRRYVLEGMPVPRPKTSELSFTQHKIEANFSNFSAWHQRSKVLASLWESGNLDRARSRDQELELVRNAMYTDPNDQSVWMYHRWLVGSGDDMGLLEREIGAIQELLDQEPDSKWCLQSLAHYKQLQLRNDPQVVDRAALSSECRSLLRQLQEFDPCRKQRYEDIDEQ